MSDPGSPSTLSNDTAFTEAEYAGLLDMAAAKYQFCDYGVAPSRPYVIWRHDVDHSPHRSLALARLEGKRRLRCIYHVLLSSRYYNLFEPEIAAMFREISALGHEIGLHVDVDVFGENASPSADEFEKRIELEKKVIEAVLGVQLRSMSFHNYVLNSARLRDQPSICGMVNASATTFYRDFRYVSDSNGIWRHQRLCDVLAEPAVPRLHVLTHPEWWTPEPLSPVARLRRLVEGRAAVNFDLYAYQLRRDGRLAEIGDRLGFTAEEIAAAKDAAGTSGQ